MTCFEMYSLQWVIMGRGYGMRKQRFAGKVGLLTAALCKE